MLVYGDLDTINSFTLAKSHTGMGSKYAVNVRLLAICPTQVLPYYLLRGRSEQC